METFNSFGSVNVKDGAGYKGKLARKRPAAITPTMSGHEALATAGIDWEVSTTTLKEIGLDVPGAQNVHVSQRSDTGGIVGVNGKKYKVIQNDVLALIGDAIREVRPDARYVGGGDLNDGKTVFLQLQLDDPFTLGDDFDTVFSIMTLVKGHDGGAARFLGSGFRLGCTNSWRMLLAGSAAIATVPHTASKDARIFQARNAVQAAVTQHDEWEETLRRLLETPVRANDAFKAIVGPRPEKEGRGLTEWENRLDNLWKEYAQDFNANLVGTGAGVFMAAQGVDEHYGRGSNKREQQQVGRLIRGSYPLAERAMATLTNA